MPCLLCASPHPKGVRHFWAGRPVRVRAANVRSGGLVFGAEWVPCGWRGRTNVALVGTPLAGA
eukprot:scaffold442_cov397-Prasinococcus_capsulatus_cf.AAC.28